MLSTRAVAATIAAKIAATASPGAAAAPVFGDQMAVARTYTTMAAHPPTPNASGIAMT